MTIDAGCAGFFAGLGPDPSTRPVLHTSPFARPASEQGRDCAWFGDSDPSGAVLYFGESPFWSAFQHAGGDPAATLSLVGPMKIGRFDLRDRRFLAPLVVSQNARGGVWDVLAHPNGRVYYTNLFGESGYYDLRLRRAVGLPEAGPGLNELALGPEGGIVASRYGSPGKPGSVVLLDADGRIVDEYPLTHASGRQVAPKTVAWDPQRDEIWIATDLLPEELGPAGHPLMVLGRDRRLRIEAPDFEVDFVRFGPDGRGYFAAVKGHDLELWTLPPPGQRRSPESGTAESGAADLGSVAKQRLADDFSPALDFVQDIHVDPQGLVVTRWSGILHIVAGEGPPRTLRLPRYEEGGLYYSGVRSGSGKALCATYCAGVDIVCTDVQGPPRLR